jgi:hypothetical protein
VGAGADFAAGACGSAGAGLAGAAGVGAAGVADGLGAAGSADGAEGAVAAGVAGAAGAGVDEDGAEAGTSVTSGVAAVSAGLAAVFFAAAFLAGAFFFSSSGNVSVALRTTGASIVELAVLTYSPMLWRWAISVLLSVPSSLASALTRTFATFLLFLVRVRTGADRRYCWGELIAEYSSGAHQRQTRLRFFYGRFISLVVQRAVWWPVPRRMP